MVFFQKIKQKQQAYYSVQMVFPAHIYIYIRMKTYYDNGVIFSIYLKTNSYLNYTVMISFFDGKIKIFKGKNFVRT